MNNTRYLWLDNVRAIACLLVVLLHSSAGYLYHINGISKYSWEIGNTIDLFTRVSVPLFFMISGYIFFRNKKPQLHNYIKIITAILFYSLIYILYIRYLKINHINYVIGIGADKNISTMLKDMVFHPVFYHLWFFYSIIVIYLFSNLITIRDNNTALGLVILAVIVFFWLNPIANTSSPLNGNIIYFVLFAIFGAYLGNFEYNKNNLHAIILLFLFIASSVFIAYKTSILSFASMSFVATYYSYISIPVIIGAFSLFVLFKMLGSFPKFVQKNISLISKNSLGIYGIHALFLSLFDVFELRNYSYPILDISIAFIATIVFSLIFSICIKLIDRKGYIS